MFDRSLNVQLGGDLLKCYDSKLTVMCGVEHTVSILFNEFSKISIANRMIKHLKAIYNTLQSCIFHYPHSIFKKKL